MKAIILAAGSSSRLGNITKNMPKGLIKINGKSIIQRQIELYRKNGINDIIIITGPNSEQFNFDNVTYIQDKNFQNHEVLGSLLVAQNFMIDGFIMTYSDILYDESILLSILNSNNDMLDIAVDLQWEKKYQNRTQHPISQADHVLIENNNILKIKKNLKKENSNQSLAEFLGIMKCSKNGANELINIFLDLNETHIGKFQNAPSFKKAYLTDILQELINRQVRVSPIFIQGNWLEIDTPQDLDNAKKIFLD